MTQDALDLLDRLSNPILAAKAEKDAARPFDRFKSTHFKADIPAQELGITSRRPAGSNFDQWGMLLTIELTEDYDGKVEPGEYTLWVRSANPTTRDGGENKRTQSSELVQMSNAAGGTNPRTWTDKKGVEFTEDTFEYKFDRNTNRQDDNGKDIWERGVKGDTYFYRLNFRAGNSSNGATVANTKPSDVAIQRALDMIKDAGTDGIKEAEFNLQASKDPVIKADKAMAGYLASGKLVSDNPDKVLRDGAMVVWVGAE